MEQNKMEETKCDHCMHYESDHYEDAAFMEADAANAARAGLCKISDCECIQFSPA